MNQLKNKMDAIEKLLLKLFMSFVCLGLVTLIIIPEFRINKLQNRCDSLRQDSAATHTLLLECNGVISRANMDSTYYIKN